VTGHQTFARDWGALVTPEQLVPVTLALLRMFIRDGDRTNRKKARFKYVVETRGLPAILKECETTLGLTFPRLAVGSPCEQMPVRPSVAHPHVGVHPQKQAGLYSIGASVPVGQMTSRQLKAVAELSENYGTGDVRLTVWQNLVLANIPEAYVDTVCKRLKKIGFDTRQSNLRSGFVACTGNRYCKFSSTDTKGHALELMDYLEKKVSLDQPVNIHLTGCAHSCAQHYMGDIGLLGAKVKTPAGESTEGYHVILGGGFGINQKVGRQIFTGVSFEELKQQLATILGTYVQRREGNESFQQFCGRHEIGRLQEMFTNGSGASA
jgi:ferredoxin-nitrite reductase